MSHKKLVFNVLLDFIVVIINIVLAYIAFFILNDGQKGTIMIIFSIGWGIRTTIHLVKLITGSNSDRQDKD